MERQIFTWGRSKNRIYSTNRRNDWLWILGLFIAAMLVLTINLGGLPLQNGHESLLSQVARDIWQAPENSWGESYLQQSPLMANLIALAYSMGGVNEWTVRLPSALLTAVSVPLLYSLGREIFVVRKPALYTALIYLTGLPVVYSGRLATGNGAILCFEVFTVWCVLRSRRDLRWSLGVGIGLGLLGLTHGGMGVLMGAIAFIFLAWDTPRLLTSLYFWSGILLGSVPLMAWFVTQWLHYDTDFLTIDIFQSSILPLGGEESDSSQTVKFYLLTILKSAIPALLFCFYGLNLTRKNLNWSWAKLVLIWSGVYFLAICLLSTQLPESILPIYPALAVAGGAKLAELDSLPRDRPYPPFWTIFLAVFALGTMVAAIYFGITQHNDPSLTVIFASVALTMGITAMLIAQRDSQFIFIFFWGSYVSLLLFVTSPHWIGAIN